MAAQEKDARKENMNNMRKNRAYQELKREMDQKRRAREKVRLFKDSVSCITGTTGMTTVAPKFLDTLTLSPPWGADSLEIFLWLRPG